MLLWLYSHSGMLQPESSRLSRAQMLPSVRMKRMQCVYACLSQSVNSSGFSRRSPHRSFLAVQNNFFWVDYTLSVASPNYRSVLLERPKQPQEQWGDRIFAR